MSKAAQEAKAARVLLLLGCTLLLLHGGGCQPFQWPLRQPRGLIRWGLILVCSQRASAQRSGSSQERAIPHTHLLERVLAPGSRRCLWDGAERDGAEATARAAVGDTNLCVSLLQM